MTDSKSGNRVFLALNIFIPLATGLLIYLISGPNSLVAEKAYGLGISFDNIHFSSGSAPEFVRNYVPDILWAYSLSFAVSASLGFLGNNPVITSAVCICFEVVIECLQKAGAVRGTFDPLDMLFEAFAVLLSSIIMNRRRDFHEKNRKNLVPDSDTVPFCRDGNRQRKQRYLR